MWLSNCWIFVNLTYFKYIHVVYTKRNREIRTILEQRWQRLSEKEKYHVVICSKLHRAIIVWKILITTEISASLIYLMGTVYVARTLHSRHGLVGIAVQFLSYFCISLFRALSLFRCSAMLGLCSLLTLCLPVPICIWLWHLQLPPFVRC